MMDTFEGNAEGCYLYSRHSSPSNLNLGEALAAMEGTETANVAASGRHAYTYNAAGLSNATRDKYDAGFSSSINATIVRGEFVDVYQRKYLDVYAEGDITYIDHESKAYVEFFNTFSPVIGTYNQIRLHFIESIINFLDCE
jgi:YD repeat-containing protein